MRSARFWMAAGLMLASWSTLPLAAQTSLNSLSAIVNVVAPEKIVAKRNSVQPLELTVQVKNGYHVNSNTPADKYLIPLSLTFVPGQLAVVDVAYPTASMEKFAFSEKPLSVFQGDFKTRARVKIPASAPAGVSQIVGKLKYQACNDRMCLPPRTLEIKVPVEIH